MPSPVAADGLPSSTRSEAPRHRRFLVVWWASLSLIVLLLVGSLVLRHHLMEAARELTEEAIPGQMLTHQMVDRIDAFLVEGLRNPAELETLDYVLERYQATLRHPEAMALAAPFLADYQGLQRLLYRQPVPEEEVARLLRSLHHRAWAQADWASERTRVLTRDLPERLDRAVLSLAAMEILLLATLGSLLWSQRRLREVLNRAREEQADRLDQVVNGSLDGIVSIDADQRIVLFNPAAERIFGWSAPEVIGQPLEQLLIPQDHAAHRRHVSAFAANDEHRRPMTPGRWVQARHHDGHVFPISVSISKSYRDGALLMTAIIRDASEEKRLLDEVQQARDEAIATSRAKSEFITTMNHEVRTPMNGILGMLRQIAREGGLPARAAERVRIAHQSAEALLLILNDALDLARVEAGRLVIDPVPVRLRQEVVAIHALYAGRADETGVTYRLVGLEHLPETVLADPGRLRQILGNLLGNAVKFTSRGSVTLSMGFTTGEGGSGTLLAEVVDTGPGIAPDALERIFTPFAQGDATTARTHGGSGLGLSIVRRLVEAHGGTITVTSTLGVGSTFRVQVPMTALDPGQLPVDRAVVDLPRWEGLVLVVDDEPVNRLVARSSLEACGLRVIEADRGTQVLADRRTAAWDLILMDIRMPGLDGPQTLAALRSLEREHALAPIPAIALTASVQPDECRRWREAGFQAVVAKPMTEGDLLRALGPVFGRPRTVVQAPLAGKVLDERHLGQLQERGLAPQLLRLFRDSLAERFALLRSTPAQANVILHGLRGAASSVGLQGLTADIQVWEADLANRPWTDADTLRLEQATTAAVTAAEAWIACSRSST